MNCSRLALSVLLVSACLGGACSKGPNQTSPVISESNAIELASNEFLATGRKAKDYRITVETDSAGKKWLVWFEKKADYPTPGGKHVVTVDKATGKAVFLQGE